MKVTGIPSYISIGMLRATVEKANKRVCSRYFLFPPKMNSQLYIQRTTTALIKTYTLAHTHREEKPRILRHHHYPVTPVYCQREHLLFQDLFLWAFPSKRIHEINTRLSQPRTPSFFPRQTDPGGRLT